MKCRRFSLFLFLGLSPLVAVSVLRTLLDQPADAAGVHHRRPALLDCTGKDGVSPKRMRQAQEAWARYLGCKVEEKVEIGKGVTMSFVLVPPGKFCMGSPKDEKDRMDDEMLHMVTLTEPFYLGKYEVTQAQYEALVGENPSHFKGMSLPVESVNWEETRDYANKLTIMRKSKANYRLPTEAEWEYACRGGRPCALPFGVGDGKSLSSLEANFDGDSPFGAAAKGPSLKTTCPVGSYLPNALGLYDMHGNVWEWCADRDGLYPDYSVTNPTGPAEGKDRVFRGGDWRGSAWACRSAHRYACGPLYSQENLGFRLARSIRSTGK